MTATAIEPLEVRPAYTKVHVLVAMAFTLVAAWVLSFLYAVVDHYSPLVYLNIVVAFGYGYCIGKVAEMMLRRLRINGKGAATLLGLIGGIGALYLAWPAYLWVITEYDTEVYFDTILNPALIWDIMGYLAEDPMWNIGKSNATWTPMYWIAWAGEVVLVIGAAVVRCSTFIETNQLCDTCKTWVAATGDTALLNIPDDQQVEIVAAVENGDLTPLLPLQHLNADQAAQIGQWLEAVGYACPNCTHENGYVNVSLVVLRPGKKSKELERTAKILVKMAEIDVETEKSLFEPVPSTVEEDGDEPEPATTTTEGGING